MKRRGAPRTIETTLRLRFPEDEVRFTWLPLLLDAYEAINAGVMVALNRERRRANRSLACTTSCDTCCRMNTDIPLYPLELAGLYWYCIEKMTGDDRQILKAQLKAHSGKPPCPFLLRKNCSVYPLRPMACRQFIVFGRTCEEGEDPFFTRRQDVMTPLADFVNKALCSLMPHHGITSAEDQARALRQGIMNKLVKNLQEYDWKALAAKMDEFDARR
ncbi:MAG TPA: YkgJ family cysteine cluster protein [Thermodesulfovibrionales bacterium]|nr:YkgJ family cysteine cluster protein [Thermodesulfovibrionales bacterium]